jgi:hypothetical protein
LVTELAGLWISQTQYQVMDPDTGKAEVVSIMGTADEMRDPIFMQECEHKARESVARDWGKPKPKRMTTGQRKDLGGTMREITQSREHQKYSLHGLYWDNLGGRLL